MEDRRPMCPYCGPWNGHPDGVEMIARSEFEMIWRFFCPVCHTESPAGASLEDARTAVLRRFQPTQKPMTLEESKDVRNNDPMYMEIATGADEIDGYWVRCQQYNETSVDFVHFGQTRLDRRNAGEYGKTWRCWRTRPTDEERAAAKWEENDQ